MVVVGAGRAAFSVRWMGFGRKGVGRPVDRSGSVVDAGAERGRLLEGWMKCGDGGLAWAAVEGPRIIFGVVEPIDDADWLEIVEITNHL